jgi:hypothetical protein
MSVVLDESEVRYCNRHLGVEKVKHHDRTKRSEWCWHCPVCHAEVERKRRMSWEYEVWLESYSKTSARMESQRARKRMPTWKQHGILGMSVEKKEYMWLEQDKKCAICRKDIPLWGRDSHVDHGEEVVNGTNVRGILCSSCNVALGHYKESVESMKRAIRYLGGDPCRSEA